MKIATPQSLPEGESSSGGISVSTAATMNAASGAVSVTKGSGGGDTSDRERGFGGIGAGLVRCPEHQDDVVIDHLDIAHAEEGGCRRRHRKQRVDLGYCTQLFPRATAFR